jgi:hypothetical protein
MMSMITFLMYVTRSLGTQRELHSKLLLFKFW